MKETFKAGAILFGALVLSRLLPLPANSEPLLGLAVLTPYLTKNNFAFLMMPAVMFVSDIFLGFGSWIWLTYPALMLATFISKFNNNKYTSLLGSWLLWHVMANTGQWFPPFSPEALLFDLRFLVSGLGIVIIYDILSKIQIYKRAETQ
jgi:integral membrane sensor domain MASE1